MRPSRTTEHGPRRGTATTETVLVIPVLLLVVGMTPWIAHMFLDHLVARTEAHRDTLDKSTTLVLMPEALMDNHVNDSMSSQFGRLTPQTRQHAFAGLPPDVPDSVDAILDPPGGSSIPLGPFSLDLFPEGFSNFPVEGWEYVRRPGAFEAQDDMHFMTYAVVIRSPWTKLGWPWLATQDLLWEPAKIQGWQGDQEKVDDAMRERYRLAE